MGCSWNISWINLHILTNIARTFLRTKIVKYAEVVLFYIANGSNLHCNGNGKSYGLTYKNVLITPV